MDARRTWDVIVPKNPSLSREGFASERDARRYAERIGRTPQAMKDRGKMRRMHTGARIVERKEASRWA